MGVVSFTAVFMGRRFDHRLGAKQNAAVTTTPTRNPSAPADSGAAVAIVGAVGMASRPGTSGSIRHLSQDQLKAWPA